MPCLLHGCYAVHDRELGQPGDGMNAQLLHDAETVGIGRANTDMKLAAIAALEFPSATSWRISRSRTDNLSRSDDRSLPAARCT